MGAWPHVATETRKIVKGEGRVIHFLDEKGRYAATSFRHAKAPCCAACRVDEVCAGLYSLDRYYSSGDLYPLFVDPEELRAAVLAEPDVRPAAAGGAGGGRGLRGPRSSGSRS
jgi:hypothetical protein